MIINDPIYTVTPEVGGYLKGNIPGLIFAREAQYLYHAPKRLGAGYYADLGTFQGLSTAALAKGIIDHGVDAKVISIDTFACTGVSEKNHPADSSKNAVAFTLERLKLNHVTELHELDFTTASSIFESFSFNFIFLDGSHDFDSVMRDFFNWHPLLKPGGEFAFHDAIGKTRGKKVWKLMEMMPDMGWEQVAQERSTMVWRKPLD